MSFNIPNKDLIILNSEIVNKRSVSEVEYIIFGAGGFIGRALTQSLSVNGRNRIAAIGGNVSSINVSGIVKIETKIDGFEVFNYLISKDTQVLYLLNTISPASTDFSKALKDTELLLKYLEWAKDRKICRTIFASSGGTVYKNMLKTPIQEDSLLEPLSFYGMSKLNSENYLKYYQRRYGLSYTILRIANPYGPGQTLIRNQGLIPYVIECANEGNPVNVIGDGSMVRDYIYIDDLTEAIVNVLRTSTTYNKILNVGSGKGSTVLEVIESIEGSMNISISKSFLPHNPNLPHSNVLDISKVLTYTSWQPKTSFKRGINLLVASII